MYTQIFLVTSVRGMDLPPQIAASAGLRVFGAKMPLPAFFMANALRLLAAFLEILPARRFSAVAFFKVAFVTVFFVVVVVTLAAVFFRVAFVTVFFVVVVVTL